MIKHSARDAAFYPRSHRAKKIYGKKEDTEANRIRHTARWKRTATNIKDRDNYLCQACINGIKGGSRVYEYNDLSVHHIIPIEEDSSLAYDDDNLITLCRSHHEMAEDGRISRGTLKKIVLEK